MLYIYIFLIIFYLYLNYNIIERFDNEVNIKDDIIIDNILNKLYIKSGGGGDYSSKSCFIKFNGQNLVRKGSDGMNIVVIERSNKMKIKNIINIDTGNDYLQNDIMIDFIQNKVRSTDIVIISVKKDAFKLMNTECRFHLELLGSKQNITKGNASYILIGSKDKKVYYEKISWSDDVFFPHIVYNELGCWKIDSSIIIDKIRLYKNLKDVPNNIEKYIEFTDRYNLIKSCSIKALSNGTIKFGITKDYCYLFNNNLNYKKEGSGYGCSNQSDDNLDKKNEYKQNEYKVYEISDVFRKDSEINENSQTYVTIYSNENYKDNYTILEPGIYSDIYFSGIELNGGLQKANIKSIKIPNNFMIIISDHLNFRRAISYTIVGPRNLPNLTQFKMGDSIKKIIVLNIKNKAIFWSRDNFAGDSYSLSYGKYIVPTEFEYTINSININIPNCRISMFFDKNFSDLYGIIENKNLQKNIYYMDNDRIIKSIIIEYIK